MTKERCVNCGAPIEYDGQPDYIFCTYCGTRIDLNKNDTHNEHIIQEFRDAARIKEADRDVELKKLEYELAALRLQAEENKRKEPANIKVLLIWIGFIVLMLLMTAWAEQARIDTLESLCAIIILGLLLATPFVLWLIFRKKR